MKEVKEMNDKAFIDLGDTPNLVRKVSEEKNNQNNMQGNVSNSSIKLDPLSPVKNLLLDNFNQYDIFPKLNLLSFLNERTEEDKKNKAETTSIKIRL